MGSSLFWVGSCTCVGCDALARYRRIGGPTGAIVLSPDVAGGVLPVDLWATQARCPQIHRHRDHNSKAIFHLVAPDPVAPYPLQIARSRIKLIELRRQTRQRR